MKYLFKLANYELPFIAVCGVNQFIIELLLNIISLLPPLASLIMGFDKL